MPIRKVAFKPGVNREKTRYASEGGWYDCDKVRFRQGYPEKIGGWRQLSTNVFLGTCRSLWNWITLDSRNFMGVGTNLKFYIESGGGYFDVTPLRKTTTNGVTFSATSGSTTITATDTSHGAIEGDFVTISGAVDLGGNITAAILNAEHQIVNVTTDTYTFVVSATATSDDSGNGGSGVDADYQINVGNANVNPLSGWGAGSWGAGSYGFGGTSSEPLRLWHQYNFGEDLVFGHKGSQLFFWDATNGVSTRSVLVSSLSGASDVPTVHNTLIVSDVSRFVFCFGTNVIGSSTVDPMLIRWSDQESVVDWTPAATNQAGSLRLSQGSEIVAAAQSRQAILVWTDAALYALQYTGPPIVWGATLVGENISIVSKNAVAYANGIAYWMGADKFYKYDGATSTLVCDVRRYIFNDFNLDQAPQVFAGTNEAFHEIWWFYCSASADVCDRYVIYNYLENIWYFGNLGRTAWKDSGTRDFPVAATTTNTLVNHEDGVDDNETSTTTAISSFITSADFDLDDGHQFMMVSRMVPDISFTGSTADAPVVNMTLEPLNSSGSGRNSPSSEGGVGTGTVTRSATTPVEVYTEQIHTRIRGRHITMKVHSDTTGVQWQLGSPRIDMRPDGRR